MNLHLFAHWKNTTPLGTPEGGLVECTMRDMPVERVRSFLHDLTTRAEGWRPGWSGELLVTARPGGGFAVAITYGDASGSGFVTVLVPPTPDLGPIKVDRPRRTS